ncbi:MAG TPA: hypothetical protein PLD47_08875 [Aggregatilineales bacterium]|nr:hypothetical protein [Anaerolineales bacterium]HRE47826.1 hypothetical protein [Aggregatilineales bacterium]
MITVDSLIGFLKQINEVLTAATVIVAFSMLLYHITHGFHDRVTRTSALLLACVTIIYVGDVFVNISRNPASTENWLRFEWLGLGFAPPALFHLSDALLSTTGLRSRGRRRRVVRLLYLIGATFVFAAAFTDLIVRDLVMRPAALMQPGALFELYVIFFVSVSSFALNNVLRARRRCLTRATRRRMSYLLFALITPVAGIFPYTLLFNQPAEAHPLLLWALINIGNFGIVLMLALMAYPLSFFGVRKPDRVIKADLLSFMLRGPVTGIAVLVVIMFVPRLNGIGVPGVEFMPFVAVTVVLALQWSYTVLIPWLERVLIYAGDVENVSRLKDLSDHLLTQTDAVQLLEANLAAICDYLRVPSAFIVTFNGEGAKLAQTVGSLTPTTEQLSAPEFLTIARNGTGTAFKLTAWQSFWLTTLYAGENARPAGVLGIWARSPLLDLRPDEETLYKTLIGRIARVLNDIRLQEELVARVDDLLEDTENVAAGSLRLDYIGAVAQLAAQTRQNSVDQPDFPDLIRDALRDYWGGARLTDDRLTNLKLVEQLLPDNEGKPAQAVRAMLTKAIERLRPEGQRSLTLPEWTLYNVVEMRFVQGKKVRDVARQLSRGEADIYRKQKIAIDQIAQTIAEMERAALQDSPLPPMPLEASPSRMTS